MDASDSTTGRLIERQRALLSAWRSLAPSGLSEEKSGIAETGRTLSKELAGLANREDSPELVALALGLEARFEALETEMSQLAFKVPIAQLRTTLPQQASEDRRGLLDLLDLMLAPEIHGLAGTEDRIPSIDYVITLLCASGDHGIEDPIQLTPRLHQLSERSTFDYDPRLPEIEAEFFAAADLYEADVRGGQQYNTLQRRKAELGSSYFAPSVLRAIVTYNAALLQRIDDEAVASQDWGSLPPPAEIAETSVFETPSLAAIASALQRRIAGEAPEFSAVDRISWCLDLDFLEEPERRALFGGAIGSRENLIGTTVLVGLLCRSAVVLEDELPSISISPSVINGKWIAELSDGLRQQVNQQIANDEYERARELSELKNKFLYNSIADVTRKSPRRATVVPASDTQARHQAKEIAVEALEIERVRQKQHQHSRWRGWVGATAIVAAVVAVVALGAFGWTHVASRDLAGYDRDQLDEVSPYLSRGMRNGQGAGTAFVGRIRDGFSALTPADRMLVATDLVGALREQGVNEIMVYDERGELQIQAFGDGPPRVVPTEVPTEAPRDSAKEPPQGAGQATPADP